MQQNGKKKSANRTLKNNRTQEKNRSVLNRERKDAASRKRDGLLLSDNDGDLAQLDRSPTARPPSSSERRITNQESTVSRRRPDQQERVTRQGKQTQQGSDEGRDEDQIAADIAAEAEEFDRQNDDDLDPDQIPYIYPDQIPYIWGEELRRGLPDLSLSKNDIESLLEFSSKWTIDQIIQVRKLPQVQSTADMVRLFNLTRPVAEIVTLAGLNIAGSPNPPSLNEIAQLDALPKTTDEIRQLAGLAQVQTVAHLVQLANLTRSATDIIALAGLNIGGNPPSLNDIAQLDALPKTTDEIRQLAVLPQVQTVVQLANLRLTTTPSGLKYVDLILGKGTKHPSRSNTVKVHYRGVLENGKEFDSSYSRGQPATFGVGQVINGLTEGVQTMKVGDKRQFIIPPDLGYGPRGAGKNIPANATLIYDVELLEIL